VVVIIVEVNSVLKIETVRPSETLVTTYKTEEYRILECSSGNAYNISPYRFEHVTSQRFVRCRHQTKNQSTVVILLFSHFVKNLRY
jgi:hypothetical protein